MPEARGRVRRFNLVKRVIDLTAVVVSAPLWAPLLGLAAGLVALTSGRPVFFRQPRIGLDEQEFEVVKLRTMRDAVTPDGSPLPDAQRITRVGTLLRRTSLDEVPQILNILRGEMSFIGPRPLLVRYLPHYTPSERARHLVRPGVTGWAQVNGRNNAPWDERLALDAEYVRRARLRDDVTVAVRTVRQVLSSTDVVIIAGHTGAPLDKERSWPRSSRVSLRALTWNDLPTRVGWMRDERVRRFMQLPEDPAIEPTHRWFEAAVSDPARQDLVAWTADGTTRIAMAGVKKDEAGLAEFYVFVDPSLAGQGFGREVSELVIGWALEHVGPVSLTVHRDNLAARRIYDDLGFTVTQEHPDRVDMVRHG